MANDKDKFYGAKQGDSQQSIKEDDEKNMCLVWKESWVERGTGGVSRYVFRM